MTLHQKLSHLWDSSLVASGVETTHHLIEEIYSCIRDKNVIHDLSAWGLSRLTESRSVMFGLFTFNRCTEGCLVP